MGVKFVNTTRNCKACFHTNEGENVYIHMRATVLKTVLVSEGQEADKS